MPASLDPFSVDQRARRETWARHACGSKGFAGVTADVLAAAVEQRLLELLRSRLADCPERVASPAFQRKTFRLVLREQLVWAARVTTVPNLEAKVDPRTEDAGDRERARIARAALRARVEALLAELNPTAPPDQVAVLRDWLCLGSYEAVAAARGMTADAVRKRWERLVARLARAAAADLPS